MLRIPLKPGFLAYFLVAILIAACASNPHKDFTQEVQNTAQTFLAETPSNQSNQTEKQFIQDKLAKLNQELEEKEFSTAKRTAQQLVVDISTAEQVVVISNIRNEISKLKTEIEGLSKEMEWRTPLTLEQVLPAPVTK